MLSDPAIMGTALSVVPSSGFPPTRTDLNYLEKLVKWFKNHFEVTTTKANPTYPEKQEILNCISSGKAKSVEELVFTCVALCRSLGILARLVFSFQPLPAKVDSSELRPKTPPDQKKIKETTLSNESEKDELPGKCKSQATTNQKAKKSSKPPVGKDLLTIQNTVVFIHLIFSFRTPRKIH